MRIPLDQFEEMFEGSLILERGLSYYEDGQVIDVAKLSDKFEITFVGTDDYLVYLEIACFTAVEYACNCPYDYGPVCKHIIALLYY